MPIETLGKYNQSYRIKRDVDFQSVNLSDLKTYNAMLTSPPDMLVATNEESNAYYTRLFELEDSLKGKIEIR